MTITAVATPDEPDRVKTPPRDDLCRSVPFTLLRAVQDRDDVDDGLTFLTFEGYGAVFNSPTRIDSYEGCFDEQIMPGAFRKSLREQTPKFQFDHGHHPMFGSLPVGVITTIHEDERGLFVQARLSDSWFWEPVRDAIKTGAVDGMSFRFSVVREEWRDRDGKIVNPGDVDKILWGDAPERGPLLRIIKEVKIAEVGPVVWPAYAGTTASVRSIDPNRLNEPEQRRLLAELLLRADAASTPPAEGDSSNDEPQDTPDQGAVEHSEADTDTPQPTDEAGEHLPETETETPPLTDEVDAARAADVDRLFLAALDEVRQARGSTPPMKGL